jgi:hypothetical protein
VSLRAELVEAHPAGVDAVSWREAVHRWRDYIRDSRDTKAVFEHPEGDRVKGGSPNRFDPEYADKQYAKLKDLERGLRDSWGKLLHTAMLTFTASSTGPDGEPVPPVDHLEDLTGSWESVRRELNRVLEGREWEYLWILEPHKSGYLHRHLAVFVKGPVKAGDFAPVIEAHVRNCDRAGWDAHDVDDDSTISVKHVGADRNNDEIGNLGTYLAEYLGTYGEDALEEPEHQQMANAILWGTQKRRWQPSQPDYVDCADCGRSRHPGATGACPATGCDCHDTVKPTGWSPGAQSYMATNRDESESVWEFVGIEDGDGEFWEAGGSGGVPTIETATDIRETDPPPDDGWTDPGSGLRRDPSQEHR